jgi:hypothetical protein
MKELQTVNCLVCGKPAKSYTGHVHHGKTTVIAGWCNRHQKENRKFSHRPVPGCEGSYGKYKEGYGLMQENSR